VCNKAVSFWSFQKQVELEYQKAEAKKRISELHNQEKTFNDKMLEAANQINAMKHKIATMRYSS
jgi:hypothetical protein